MLSTATKGSVTTGTKCGLGNLLERNMVTNPG